jgi:uncharacterized damage-inducible protein DinB
VQHSTRGKEFLAQLEVEVAATRKCLERIPETVYNFKPHEKSMQMGYLTLLVGEMPRWITKMVQHGEIDLANYDNFQLSTTDALLKHFEDNIAEVRQVLQEVTDDRLDEHFTLRAGDKVMIKEPIRESIDSTIRHWVHHRGQLTVYMRLNDIAVPSVYGPSADDRGY